MHVGTFVHPRLRGGNRFAISNNENEVSAMAAELQRRNINVAEYHRMAEAGILRPRERVELLRGDIVKMAPIGDPHRGTVNRLTRLLSASFSDRACVQVQNPVVVGDDSEPEPDIALLKINEAAWGERAAYPSDIIALVEVAQTSRDADLNVKPLLYGQSHVPEYWVVDLIEHVVRVYREPGPDGYRTTLVVRSGEAIALSAYPLEPLAVDDILPRPHLPS